MKTYNYKIKQRNKVYAYCHDCIDHKKEILLSTISGIIDPDNPEKFQDFATDDEHKVSAIISGDKARMKFLKTISYSDDDFKIEFDTKLLVDKTIHFDSKTKKLTIKNIPRQLEQKIIDLNNNNAG